MLTDLYVGNNELSHLPNTIGKLTSLKILDLKSNHLTTLPETIGDLSMLTDLYVGDNHLSHLPITNWVAHTVGCTSPPQESAYRSSPYLPKPIELAHTLVGS